MRNTYGTYRLVRVIRLSRPLLLVRPLRPRLWIPVVRQSQRVQVVPLPQPVRQVHQVQQDHEGRGFLHFRADRRLRWDRWIHGYHEVQENHALRTLQQVQQVLDYLEMDKSSSP